MTLGLVAFGLVMVYSATSASAAVGDGDPMAFLERQAIYAFLGVVLMALASRFDYHRLLRRASSHARRPRPMRGRAGRRAGDQRRAPLVPARPGQLPAVRARKAVALSLRRGPPRAAPTAPNVRRAREAAGVPDRDLLRADPARARPRDHDHALRDDARRLPRGRRLRPPAGDRVVPRDRRRAARDLR